MWPRSRRSQHTMFSGPVHHLQPEPPVPDHVSTYLPAVTSPPEAPVEHILGSLGVYAPTVEELALASMWAGAFVRSGNVPDQLDRSWWGVQLDGTYALGVVDHSFWPPLDHPDHVRSYQPRPTRIGVYANLPRGTFEAGQFKVGVSWPEAHKPPKPLIFRPANRRHWRTLGHQYRADTTNGFFDRLLHRALGVTQLVPDTIPAAGRSRGHHIITTRKCAACDSRPYAAIGAAGCMYPPEQITPS